MGPAIHSTDSVLIHQQGILMVAKTMLLNRYQPLQDPWPSLQDPWPGRVDGSGLGC